MMVMAKSATPMMRAIADMSWGTDGRTYVRLFLILIVDTLASLRRHIVDFDR
jgi:hypothetical protein